MIFFDKHRRARNNFSAYIDGELSESERARVDAHLKTCDICTTEIAQMRAMIGALAALPESGPRRSFQLTPEMVQQPRARPAYAPSHGLANGMRMAAAGLAAALVIVFVVDANDSGTGMDPAGGERAVTSQETSEDLGDSIQVPGQGGVDSSGDGFQYYDGSGADGAGDDVTAAPDAAGGDQPQPTQSNLDADDRNAETSEDDSEPPAAPDEDAQDGGDAASGDILGFTDSDGGDGIGTLQAIEIALGVALAITVAAALWLTFASRTRDQRL